MTDTDHRAAAIDLVDRHLLTSEHYYGDTHTRQAEARAIVDALNEHAKAHTDQQPAANPATPDTRTMQTITTAIHVADACIEGNSYSLADAINAALISIGVEYPIADIQKAIEGVDGWDETEASELARHIVGGMHHAPNS
ncbi:hypothetical protein [Melissospora conviva]|uniref:hypothetical protein n=1 Tax=Melissospora conviva TaxID=3388432 RepID=UPI003C19932E